MTKSQSGRRRTQNVIRRDSPLAVNPLDLDESDQVVRLDNKACPAPTLGIREGWVELIARDVRPDSRNRIALGRAFEKSAFWQQLDDVSFSVYQDDWGRIILEPQVTIPASEAWLFRNKKALDSVRRGLNEAAEGKAERLGSFAPYADDEP